MSSKRFKTLIQQNQKENKMELSNIVAMDNRVKAQRKAEAEAKEKQRLEKKNNYKHN